MVKLILNKKYKANDPGDVIDANKRLEELLINKGMAHYAPIVIKAEKKVVKKPRKPRKKKPKKFKW